MRLTTGAPGSNLSGMQKQHAIDVFGSAADLARELGMTRQAVQAWPDPLGQKQVDRLIGLAVRKGKVIELLAGMQQQDPAA
jgi:hypothetical protein